MTCAMFAIITIHGIMSHVRGSLWQVTCELLSNMATLILLLPLSALLSQAVAEGRKIKFQIIFHSTLRSRCVVSLRHVSAWDKDCQWGLGVSVQEQQRQEGSRYTINLNCAVSDNLGQTSARLEFFYKKVNLRAGDRINLPYRGEIGGGHIGQPTGYQEDVRDSASAPEKI